MHLRDLLVCVSVKCHFGLFLEPCNGFHGLALSIFNFWSKTSCKLSTCHRTFFLQKHDFHRGISFIRVYNFNITLVVMHSF